MCQPGDRPFVSLVIPAYNEEDGIAQAIAEADEALRELRYDYEILVVDDGSQDRTFEIATAATVGRRRVRVLRHEQNRGYGAALRTGFENAHGQLVAFTDADCQFDLTDLRRLIPLTHHAPVAVGYRVDRQDPWRRRFLSAGYNFLIRRLLGTRVRDVDCALKVFRREALDHLLPQANNFFVNTEMLTRARQLGMEIREVGVRHRPRRAGSSKVSLCDVPQTLRTLLPFWWSRVMFPARSSDVGRSGRWSLVALAIVCLLLILSSLGPSVEARGPQWTENRMSAAVPLWFASGTAWLIVHIATIAWAGFWGARLVGWRAATWALVLLMLAPLDTARGTGRIESAGLSLMLLVSLSTAHDALSSRSGFRWWWLAAGLVIGGSCAKFGVKMLALILPPLVILSWLDERLRRPRKSDWLILVSVALSLQRLVQVMGIRLDTGGELREIGFISSWQPVSGAALSLWILSLWLAIRDLTKHERAAKRHPAQGVLLMMAAWLLLASAWSGDDGRSVGTSALIPLALALGCTWDSLWAAQSPSRRGWRIETSVAPSSEDADASKLVRTMAA